MTKANTPERMNLQLKLVQALEGEELGNQLMVLHRVTINLLRDQLDCEDVAHIFEGLIDIADKYGECIEYMDAIADEVDDNNNQQS